MSEYREHLSSPTNPDGLFEAITASGGDYERLPFRARIAAAIADTYTFAVEVVGLYPEMAEVFTARSITEATRAINPDISADILQEYLVEGFAYAEDEMAERAIRHILG